MRKVLTLAAVCLLAISVQAADLTVDEILAKNAEARGGMEKLRALQGVRFSGKMSVGPMELPFTLTQKRPEMMRLEFTVQGMTGIQAYDGSTGWSVMPFMGKKDPEAMGGDELKMAKEQADFDGQLVDYAKKGHKVELLGKGDVEGTPAHKLKLTAKDGAESTIYIDAETFLEVKREAKRTIQGQEAESTTILGNYQDVDGHLFPFSIEVRTKMGNQNITIEKAEINPAVDHAIFKMPVKAAAAPAEVKQQ
jgi:outer membrane lipoprotein-sorting protein